MKYQVYKIVNIINGKFYIGATSVGLRRRFLQHCNEKQKNTILKNAIKKYGKINFIIEEIETLETRAEMYEREIYWIGFYRANYRNIGYNISIGGNCGPIMYGENHPNFGKPPHPNTLAACKRKRGPMSQENKDLISAGNKGKKKAEKWKEFMSENNKKLCANRDMKAVGKKISATKKSQNRPSHRRTLIICLNNNKIYDHYQEAAKHLGVSAGNIPQVVNGIYSHTKGFKFERVTSEHLIF